MNKNIAIGLLAAVIILGGGYYLMSKKDTIDTTTPPITQTNTTPSATNPPSTVPPLTLGSPTVTTNQNSSVSISTAFVNGQVSTNGLSTTYWFEYGETSSLGNKTSTQQLGSGFTTISAPAFISNLKSNTTYYFRLSAKNNLGSANGTIYSFKTNSAPAPKVALPTARTNSATNVLRDTANINGQVNPNGLQTNYWFEYGKDINFGNTNSIKSINGTTTSSVSESLAGLEPLTKYYFRLNAQNSFGTVNGTILNFTTKGPLSSSAPAVTTSSASNVDDSTVTLNGRINPNGADTTYYFDYSTDSLLGKVIGSGTTTEVVVTGTNTVNVKANVTGLEKKTKYFFHLVGRNQYGTVKGSILSFTTKSQ